MIENNYTMTISRMTVDKLGVKLYDRVSAVIAELVANGYDADAQTVTIKAPMGTYLAATQGGQVSDSGYEIVVQDDGCGMPPGVINSFYLKVGAERRGDPRRGNKSARFNRLVMGRKGVGKLAPFGICNRIEVISSGGELEEETDADGNSVKGYRTAHFVMVRDAILHDIDEEYKPELGNLDNTLQPKMGTIIKMTDFIRRKVPDMESLDRQLAQRFGVRSENWRIKLMDTNLAPGTERREAVVGDFTLPTMPATRISFKGPTSEVVDSSRKSEFSVIDEDGNASAGVEAGFTFETGRFYPVLGWVAYSKESYRDELMAGVRIYCRGKIAAQTTVFNKKSGFTGEFNIRSYLVGELHADWLDEDEDLIQTDRRDILWSDPLGQYFEKWGQDVVALVGTKSREPMKKRTWEQFLEIGDVENRIKKTYPGEKWEQIRKTSFELTRRMGERLREDEVKDSEYVESLIQLGLMLGPHVGLDEALHEAGGEETPIEYMTRILKTARVAELSSYGAIAERRVKVIKKVSRLTGSGQTAETELQNSLCEAPWLINPLWSPITENRTLSTLKNRFEQFYEEHTHKRISLVDFSESGIRPDFVLSSDDHGLQIIEIKRPEHALANDEWDRVQRYIDVMDEFLKAPGNEEFKAIFKTFTVTIVCDKINLTGSQLKAFDSFRKENRVVQITWSAFLLRTNRMHAEFLEEARRQRDLELR